VAPGAAIPYAINVSNGTWDASATVLSGMPSGNSAWMASASCASATECVATGYYGANGPAVPFTVDEIRGSWGTVQSLSGYADGASPYQVSCAAPGDCAIAGVYAETATHTEAFTADEIGYTWSPVQQVPGSGAANTGNIAEADAISCPSPGNCAAVGYYLQGSAYTPFVVERKWADPTTTSVALSAGTVAYGDEQAVHATVTVTPGAYVLPGGTATVKAGSTTLCTVKLTVVAGSGSDKGNCAIPATRLPAGTAKVTASYNGVPGYAASTSGYKVLKVTRAASKTSLTLSAAGVRYGHETSERLSVAVSPQYAGVPSGTVRIASGKTLICVISLKSGKGSCVLKATQLKAGGYSLVASYSGSVDFTASASPTKALTITH
jgi:hypothetical protein